MLATIAPLPAFATQADQARRRQAELAPRVEAQRREVQRVFDRVRNTRLMISRPSEEGAFAVVDFDGAALATVVASGANLTRWQIVNRNLAHVRNGQYVFGLMGVLPANSSYSVEISGAINGETGQFSGTVTFYRGGGWPEQIRATGSLVPLMSEGR